MAYLQLIYLTCLSLHKIANPLSSKFDYECNCISVLVFVIQLFPLLDTCIPGCFLTDLTSTDAVRQCAENAFASTLPIPNGAVCYSRTTAGSKALYICNDGFHQDGAATRVCQSEGVWNGSIPQCLPDMEGEDGITSSVPVSFHQGTY